MNPDDKGALFHPHDRVVCILQIHKVGGREGAGFLF